MDLIDLPSAQSFQNANTTAMMLGFVSPFTEEGYGLTPIGQKAAVLSKIPMEAIRVLLTGYTLDVAMTDLITIISTFGQLQNIWRRSITVPASGTASPHNLTFNTTALFNAIPSFIRDRIEGSNMETDKKLAILRFKLLVADEFIEFLLIYDMFLDMIQKSNGDMNEITAWCELQGLNFDGLMEFTSLREFNMEDILAAEIDPFRMDSQRLRNQSADNFLSYVKKIKQCLYEGLYNHLLIFDESKMHYTSRDLIVTVPNLNEGFVYKLKQISPDVKFKYPKYLVTDWIKLMPPPAKKDQPVPLIYSIETNMISVMDGFVDIDLFE